MAHHALGVLAYGAMRALYVMVALAVPLFGCDFRTDEDKRLEAKRLEMIRLSNEIDGRPDLRWVAEGKHHTIFIRVQPFGPGTPEQIREAMLKEMSKYDAGKEETEKEGWTHVGYRDRDTGLEVIKPVSELRGIDAVMAEQEAKEAAARPVVPQQQ
ncbi:hypothetical protein [Myxococcus sp. Y35]|uniref:hypothetical protein n=1 Tax=Pseudomyxococcus flavus TaxID=3115648 RepID=UPI003CF4EFC4